MIPADTWAFAHYGQRRRGVAAVGAGQLRGPEPQLDYAGMIWILAVVRRGRMV
jgi:hypothetical protein